MKTIKIYSSIFAFIFAIGSMYAAALSAVDLRVAYRQIGGGGSVEDPSKCAEIKMCDNDGVHTCRYRPGGTGPITNLFGEENGVCSLPLKDNILVE